MTQRIDGPQGWYDIVYIELLNSVEGAIRAGTEPVAALVRVFDDSCASKGIKHRVEDEIKAKYGVL